MRNIKTIGYKLACWVFFALCILIFWLLMAAAFRSHDAITYILFPPSTGFFAQLGITLPLGMADWKAISTWVAAPISGILVLLTLLHSKWVAYISPTLSIYICYYFFAYVPPHQRLITNWWEPELGAGLFVLAVAFSAAILPILLVRMGQLGSRLHT